MKMCFLGIPHFFNYIADNSNLNNELAFCITLKGFYVLVLSLQSSPVLEAVEVPVWCGGLLYR